MNTNENNNKSNLSAYTINNILHAGNWMNEIFSDHLKRYALSIQQYQVLSSLRELEGKPSDLVSLHTSMVSKNSNTTRLVEKLRLKGLITRTQNEENRRKVNINITSKGLELLTEIDLIQTSFENEVVENLTEDEILTLNKLLKKIRKI